MRIDRRLWFVADVDDVVLDNGHRWPLYSPLPVALERRLLGGVFGPLPTRPGAGRSVVATNPVLLGETLENQCCVDPEADPVRVEGCRVLVEAAGCLLPVVGPCSSQGAFEPDLPWFDGHFRALLEDEAVR